MTLFNQVSEDIKFAMKARDKVHLETLRNIKKVFLEAKTAPGANDTLAEVLESYLPKQLSKKTTLIFLRNISSRICRRSLYINKVEKFGLLAKISA